MKKRVLLIIPPSSVSLYSKSKIKAAVSEIPYISQATLAGALIQDQNIVKILDLSIFKNPIEKLSEAVKDFNPDFAGVTFTTPLYYEALAIAGEITKLNPMIKLVGGGVHASALPEETLKESKFDVLVIGEGDKTIVELVNTDDFCNVDGLCFKDKNNNIVRTKPRELIKNLDELPYPAWHLYDLKSYKASRLTSRKNPVGAIETSRGCVFGCTYCNKDVFGRKFRMKSAERVIDEMEYMLRCGFREIHIWDDNFVTNISRAKKICDLIVERALKFPWSLACGVRVDCVDEEFLIKAKRAGCYSVYFGVETSSDTILKSINKGIKKSQIVDAFKMAKKVGMETLGFFMFGLPGETETTMKETIEFAQELNSDYAKVTILVPFPSTPIYHLMEKEGRIKTRDWSKYNFHTASQVYTHETLDWKTLDKYYSLFYREFYFRPKYIISRLLRGLSSGRIFMDGYYFIRTWIM